MVTYIPYPYPNQVQPSSPIHHYRVSSSHIQRISSNKIANKQSLPVTTAKRVQASDQSDLSWPTEQPLMDTSSLAGGAVGGERLFSHSFIKSEAVRLKLLGVRRFSTGGKSSSSLCEDEPGSCDREDFFFLCLIK